MVGRYTLEEALNDSWGQITSHDPENWSKENPAWGQGGVTACIVQDYLGGEILWSKAKLPDGRELSHYFNRWYGEVIDFTRKQFPEGTIIPPGADKKGDYSTTRKFILSFDQTRKRYDILKRRVAEELD